MIFYLVYSRSFTGSPLNIYEPNIPNIDDTNIAPIEYNMNPHTEFNAGKYSENVI